MRPGSAYRLPSSARQLERYHYVRGLGVTPSSAAMDLATNISRFRAFVSSKGMDPDTLGDFARDMSRSKAKR
jgi:hypothetical protein